MERRLARKQKERELYFRNVFKLPIRDGALLETLVAQEHVNTHQVVVALEQETTVYKAEVEQLQVEQDVQTKQLKDAETRFHAAKSVNEKFIDLQQKNEKYNNLQENRAELKGKKNPLNVRNKQSAYYHLNNGMKKRWKMSRKLKVC